MLLETYSDITAGLLEPPIYCTPLLARGLVSPRDCKDATTLGTAVRRVWLRLLLNPAPELCERVKRHLENMRGSARIGMQLRLGGQHANFVEREMLSVEALQRAQRLVWDYVRRNRLSPENVTVFISSDSDFAIRRMKKALQWKGRSMVYVANDFPVGHSAEAKTSKRKKELWESFTKRAILDLMILKESDYLIYSQKSSFGKFARELQMAYANPVDVDPFLKEQGLQCSVYFNRSSVGSSTYL